MNFSNILDKIISSIKEQELYQRSLVLGLRSLSINLSFDGMEFESLGLYSLVGKYDLSDDTLYNLSINCDFGFLYYLMETDIVIEVNVLSAKLPLPDTTLVSSDIKLNNHLDLSLYNNKILCMNRSLLHEFYFLNAHNVEFLGDFTFEFNLCHANDKDIVGFLYYFLNDVIADNKNIYLYFVPYESREITLKKVHTIEDLKSNISSTLNYYLPFILDVYKKNVYIEVLLDYQWYYCYDLDMFSITEKELNKVILDSLNSLLPYPHLSFIIRVKELEIEINEWSGI